MKTPDEQKIETTTFFLFKELDIPDLFWWKDLDMILHHFRNTIYYLNRVLERAQGRVCWYRDNQPQLIGINTANRKIIAREMFDDLRHKIESRCNDVDKELITERAKKWLAEIEKESDPTPEQMTEMVVFQLRRCFEPVEGSKYPHYAPYRDYDDLDETDLDQYGYYIGYDRKTERECEMLVEAYRVWAQKHQQCQMKRESQMELPKAIDKGNAKKYYDRALEHSYLNWSGSNATWERKFTQLGYFCNKIYKSPRPINDLEKFFNVRKLSAAISQADNKAIRADVIAWRAEMDSLIFFD